MIDVILEDESLRDGLQFERMTFPLEEKITIFDLLVDAGFKRVQVGSFVHPKVVPQMADTEVLIQRIKDTTDILITGLILNGRGLERAFACGLGHVSMSISVSDSHSRKNVKRSVKESLGVMIPLISKAVDAGLIVRAGAQCAFGCVYEGHIPEDKVLEVLATMTKAGATEINLADTTGMANPVQIKRLIKKVKSALPHIKISLHLHDTRGLGLANTVAGFEAGVKIFDVAAGGLGGCPFVKGASGNIPAEDVVNLFEQMGVNTAIDLKALCRVVQRYETLLDRRLPGRMCHVLNTLENCSAKVRTIKSHKEAI
jgi:hydroxymethylglutaryl-CoA lyase